MRSLKDSAQSVAERADKVRAKVGYTLRQNNPETTKTEGRPQANCEMSAALRDVCCTLDEALYILMDIEDRCQLP